MKQVKDIQAMMVEIMRKTVSSRVLEFVTSEKNLNGGKFTVKSLKTGKEYTYKIQRKKWAKNNTWYTFVSVETQYLKWKKLGNFKNGQIFKSGTVNSSPASVAIAAVLSKVVAKEYDWLDERMEVFHTGCCVRCGAELTDSVSIEAGLGPVCGNR